MPPNDKPPRVWSPGLLYVSEDRELCRGPSVGYAGRGGSFKHTRVGVAGSLGDRRHTAWLVERAFLADAVVDEHAILLAETLVDAERQPHAHRWLAEQPLVCVSGSKKRRLVDAGLRVYEVASELRGAEVWVRLEASGGKRHGWLVEAPLSALERLAQEAEARADAGPRTRVMHPPMSIVDRVLGQLSLGVVTEQGVLGALAARELIEPGYGYHGQTDGVAAVIGDIEHDVRALDELFGSVYRRAEGMAGDARAIATALVRARDEDETVAVPLYGAAERFLEPAIELDLASVSGARYVAAGEPRDRLELPSVSRWFVKQVAMWRPKLSPELEQQLSREAASRRAPPEWLPIVLLALLLLVGLCAYLLR